MTPPAVLEDREERLKYAPLMAVWFLRAVLAVGSGLLEIRALPSGREWFFNLDAADALYDAVELAGEIAGEDVYFGVHARTCESGRNDAVEACSSLFADCDSDAALDALTKFKPAPSFIVESGGFTERERPKVHVYWLLREAVDPETARSAKKRLALALGSDDAVHDPARILRLPATAYHKDGSGRAVRVVKSKPDLRYSLEDVIAALPDLAAKTSTNGEVNGTIPEGSRNTSLASAAGALRARR